MPLHLLFYLARIRSLHESCRVYGDTDWLFTNCICSEPCHLPEASATYICVLIIQAEISPRSTTHTRARARDSSSVLDVYHLSEFSHSGFMLAVICICNMPGLVCALMPFEGANLHFHLMFSLLILHLINQKIDEEEQYCTGLTRLNGHNEEQATPSNERSNYFLPCGC